MGKKRVLVGYGIDVDSVSNHINTTVGGSANLCNVSRGKCIPAPSATTDGCIVSIKNVEIELIDT